MFLRVPFTEIYVNEFGTVRYTGWKGENREDQGFKNKCKYMMIKTQSGKFYYVHRLVARVFVKNPCPEYFKVVHHLDNNRSNNYAENLQWTTKALNNSWKKNQRLVKKTQEGYIVSFIFNKKTFNLQKVHKTLEDAKTSAKSYKLCLINATRSHIIECSRSSLDPYEEHNEIITRVTEAAA